MPEDNNPIEEPIVEEPPVEPPPPEPLGSKSVVQLDEQGYFQGMTTVDEDPMDRGTYMLPPMALDITPPVVVEGARARWNSEAESWVYEDVSNPLTSDFTVYRTRALMIVDAEVDMIYKQVIGNRAPEYEAAEREAQDFFNAGFEGDPPPSVADWADIKQWTPQAAAENILLQATQWRYLSASVMRSQRLRTKEALRGATTSDGVTAIMAGWQAHVASWKSALGL